MFRLFALLAVGCLGCLRAAAPADGKGPSRRAIRLCLEAASPTVQGTTVEGVTGGGCGVDRVADPRTDDGDGDREQASPGEGAAGAREDCDGPLGRGRKRP